MTALELGRWLIILIVPLMLGGLMLRYQGMLLERPKEKEAIGKQMRQWGNKLLVGVAIFVVVVVVLGIWPG